MKILKRNALFLASALILTLGFVVFSGKGGIKPKLMIGLYNLLAAGMGAGAFFCLYSLRRKANIRIILGAAIVNFLFVSAAVVLIYFLKDLPSGVAAFIDTLKKMRLPSHGISTLLLVDVLGFLIFNYLFHAGITGGRVKKHVPNIIFTISIFVFLLLYLNTGSILKLLKPQNLYIWLSAIMLPAFVLNFSDIKIKKGRILLNAILAAFSVTEIFFLLFGVKIFPVLKNQALFHGIIIFLLAANFLFGMIVYHILKNFPLQKKLSHLLVFLLAVIVAVLFRPYGKNLASYSVYVAIAYISIALPFIGFFLVYNKKKTILKERLIYLVLIACACPAGLYIMAEPPPILRFGVSSAGFSLLSAVPLLIQIASLVLLLYRPKKTIQKNAASKGRASAEKIPPPFDAYGGNADYIFISYSHRDMKDVFTIAHYLFQKGLRIWYDEGIEPGEEWPEVIGKALGDCRKFLVFLSRSAVLSRNVRNEINYAFSKKKEMIVVLLEKTSLTYGLNLQLGTVQAIKKYEMNDKEFNNTIVQILKAK